MCERNPLNPGYVGSLLNFTPPESLYFSNLRGNGAHIPGLQIPYNRREVCTLPWISSNSCTPGPAAPPPSRAFGGYCPPFLSNSLSLNTNSSSGHVKAHLEETARGFQVTNHKTEESGRREEAYVGDHVGSDRGFSELDRRSHGSAAQLDPDSAGPLNVNSTKQEQDPIQPSSSHTCSRTSFAEGKVACCITILLTIQLYLNIEYTSSGYCALCYVNYRFYHLVTSKDTFRFPLEHIIILVSEIS